MGVFSMLVVAYLFLGGTGGGALVVLSLLEVANAPCVALRRWLLPSEFFARAWTVCAVALGLSVVCLLADVGRIDRSFLLFASPVPSVLAVGAWSLAIACALACAFALANALAAWGLRARMAVPGGIAGVIAGVAVVCYTGVLLWGMPSIFSWQTPLVPALFSLSGVSCGVALCLGAWAFVECRAPLIGPFIALSRVDSVVVLLEAVCLAGYTAWLFASPATSDAAHALVAGELRWAFWIALVVGGLVVPLALERLLTYENSRNQLLWIALFVLVGGLVLRCLVVDVSVFDATQAESLAQALVLS